MGYHELQSSRRYSSLNDRTIKHSPLVKDWAQNNDDKQKYSNDEFWNDRTQTIYPSRMILWQLSNWSFQDQTKDKPITTQDFKQDMIVVPGLFREHERDGSYMIVLLSSDHFRNMFGQFPRAYP